MSRTPIIEFQVEIGGMATTKVMGACVNGEWG